MTFRVNLFEDFCELIKDWARRGIASNYLRVSGMARNDKTLPAWINKHAVSAGFEICSQRLSIRPRVVTVSPSFQCPDELRNRFQCLKRHIENGDDLNPYLGNNLTRLGKHDPMLANWGIRHFHTMPVGQRVRGQDDALIFAWLSEDSAYIIAVGTHNDFDNTEYLKDLQNCYPAALGPEINEQGIDVDSSEYKTILSLRLNAAVRINGHVYYSPGGGRNMDGCSTIAYRDAMVLRRRLDAASQVLRDGLYDALRRLVDMNLFKQYEGSVLDIKLNQFDDREIRVVCPRLGLLFSYLDKRQKIAILSDGKDGRDEGR